MVYSPEDLTKKFSLYRVGKVYWKKETGVKPRTVFLRQVAKNNLGRANEIISIARDLRKLGLPVPHQGLVDVPGRLSTKYYIATEAFFKGRGRSKIVPFNKPFFGIFAQPYPTLLRRLSLHKNEAVIKELASCVVKIVNSGFSIHGLDVFGLYKKKDGTLGLVIHDLEAISHPNKAEWPLSAAMGLKKVYLEAATVWSPARHLSGLKLKDPRLKLFWGTIMEQLAEPVNKELDFAWSLSGSAY
ncbi:MAG: hypothetical protein PHH08_03315 [Candidatus ainarchaeum sp.]|nr:hypothetical protein [Candidatus ainarchaeum sp.]